MLCTPPGPPCWKRETQRVLKKMGQIWNSWTPKLVLMDHWSYWLSSPLDKEFLVGHVHRLAPLLKIVLSIGHQYGYGLAYLRDHPRTHLGSKICSSNCIPYHLGCRKSNEIADKGDVPRINQPPFNNSIVYVPSSKGSICQGWLSEVAIYISQFVFAWNIHLDNLEPKSIVGAIQLDIDRRSSNIGGLGWG